MFGVRSLQVRIHVYKCLFMCVFFSGIWLLIWACSLEPIFVFVFLFLRDLHGSVFCFCLFCLLRSRCRRQMISISGLLQILQCPDWTMCFGSSTLRYVKLDITFILPLLFPLYRLDKQWVWLLQTDAEKVAADRYKDDLRRQVYFQQWWFRFSFLYRTYSVLERISKS